MTTPIYLDNHATTPVDPRVAETMVEAMVHNFGNPNSADHEFGDRAARAVAIAAGQVAELVGAEADDIVFTTGASEALRLALGYAGARVDGRPLKVAASPIEHPALIDALERGESEGSLEVTWLPVNEMARVSLDLLGRVMAKGVDLVCLMAANNEVGTLQALEEAAQLAGQHRTDLLVDATQAAGKMPIAVRDWRIEYLVLSAHKIYGPKGVGALVSPAISSDAIPAAFSHHASTPNVPGIVGFGQASRIALLEMDADNARIGQLRDRLQAALQAALPGLVVNGDLEHRLAGNLHVSIPNAPNDAVVANLRRTVALSTGAACASGADAPSHVLRAMDLPSWRQEGALRMGVGRFNTEQEIDRAVVEIVTAVRWVAENMQAYG